MTLSTLAAGIAIVSFTILLTACEKEEERKREEFERKYEGFEN